MALLEAAESKIRAGLPWRRPGVQLFFARIGQLHSPNALKAWHVCLFFFFPQKRSFLLLPSSTVHWWPHSNCPCFLNTLPQRCLLVRSACPWKQDLMAFYLKNHAKFMCRHQQLKPWNQVTWVQILAALLCSHMTSNNMLNLSQTSLSLAGKWECVNNITEVWWHCKNEMTTCVSAFSTLLGVW